MELNKIYNEDCFETLKRMDAYSVDTVLTSPPYNTSRKGNVTDNKVQSLSVRYDGYNDCKTNKEYVDWTVNLFNEFDRVLVKNGNILYNMSYSSENLNLMWLTVAAIIERTPFCVADTMVWKKKTALPLTECKNKLTRICEFVFIICRESEQKTFNSYRDVISVRQNGQQHYTNVYNIIEAANNDESCPIHKATYSTELCVKLMNLYTKNGGVVYDPFIGTGTTALACVKTKRQYIGSEISQRYCEWAERRLKVETDQLKLF